MKKFKLLFTCFLFTGFSYTLLAQTNNNYINATGNNNLIFQTSNLQRMAILADGNVQFSSLGVGNGLVTFDSSGIIKPLAFSGNASTVLTGAGTFTTVASLSPWQTNGTNIYYKAGNIGIGTCNPKYNLQIVGNVYDSGSIFATNIAVQNNILVGNFRLINGALTGGSDTIASLGKIHIQTDTVNVSGMLTAKAVNAGTGPSAIAINGTAGTITSPSQKVSFANDTVVTSSALKAGGLNISGSSVAMPGIVTDTSIDVMTIDAKGNLTPKTIQSVLNIGNTHVSFFGACNTIGANKDQWINIPSTNRPDIEWTEPCTWVGIGTSNPDAPLTISNINSATGIQFSIANPISLTDVFTIDGSGNTQVLGNLSMYTSGGNNSLFFGQDQFLLPGENPNSLGAWGIQYVPGSANSGSPGGLNFWKPYIGTNNVNNFGTSYINGFLWLSDNGNVGIGTTKPAGQLDIEGTPPTGTPGLIVGSGNVGIGTTTPGYPLDVVGTIRVYEVKVCEDGCDFVFDDNYQLMPLKELEQYLNLTHHLPGVASAKEMENGDGVALGKMNSKLLQKVEELTLYIIQQNKSIDKQQVEIEELQTKLETLSKEILK